MIEITPEIVGPGIEEEYADAIERIDKLLVALERFPKTNERPEGRVKLIIEWLKQEIERERLPIPARPEYLGTLKYVVGDGTLDYIPGVAQPLGQLVRILEGHGLIKPRHYPAMISEIDDMLALLPKALSLNEIERTMIIETYQIRKGLAEGKVDLPLNESNFPGWKNIPLNDPSLSIIPDFRRARISVGVSLFSGYRPRGCEKPPMAPPDPGPVAWSGIEQRNA